MKIATFVMFVVKQEGIKIEKPQVSFKLEKVECIDFLDLSLQWSKFKHCNRGWKIPFDNNDWFYFKKATWHIMFFSST